MNRVFMGVLRIGPGALSWPSPWRSPRGLQMLALSGHTARRWESKRLRLRFFTLPVTIARTGLPAPAGRSASTATKAPWADSTAPDSVKGELSRQRLLRGGRSDGGARTQLDRRGVAPGRCAAGSR